MRASATWLLACALLGCGASLTRHAEHVTPPERRDEIARALAELDHLREEGWIARIRSGACRRTYRDEAAGTGDIIGDIASATDPEETTPPACRAALEAIEDLARRRARFEADPYTVGGVDAFASAMAELSPVDAPCRGTDDAEQIMIAIVRHEHELGTWSPRSLAWPGIASGCDVPTLAGLVALVPRAEEMPRWEVTEVVVHRGDVAIAGASRADERSADGSLSRDDHLLSLEGPWSTAAVVLVHTLAGSCEGAGAATYELMRAPDGWRVTWTMAYEAEALLGDCRPVRG